MVVAGFECPYAGACNLGDLFVGHVVAVLHVEDEALFVGQAQESLLEFALYFIAGYVWRGVDLLRELAFDVYDGQEEPTLFALQKGEAFVSGNAIDPREQLGVFAKVLDVAVDFDKDFLGKVVCIVVIDYHFTNVAVDALLVLSDQQVKAIVPGFRITYFV